MQAHESGSDSEHHWVVFDCATRQWAIKTTEDIAIPDQRVTWLRDTIQFRSVRSQEIQSIFMIGDCVTLNDMIYKLSLTLPLIWDVERLLWIGYKKNDDNPQCFFRLLSKDVIIYISKMSQWSLLNSAFDKRSADAVSLT